ncbi:hypothetical protein HDZ31DRAFT_82143 [Schizophyllum fasciatum]
MRKWWKAVSKGRLAHLLRSAGIDVFCQIPASVPCDTSAAIHTMRHRPQAGHQMDIPSGKRLRALSLPRKDGGKRTALTHLFDTFRPSRRAATTGDTVLAKPWNALKAPRLPSENRPPEVTTPPRKGAHGHNKAAPRGAEASRATPSHGRASKSTPPLAKSLKAAGVHILAEGANLRDLSDERGVYTGTYLTVQCIADRIRISWKWKGLVEANEGGDSGANGVDELVESLEKVSEGLHVEHAECCDVETLLLLQKAVAETMEGSGDCLNEVMTDLKIEALTRFTAALGRALFNNCPGPHFTSLVPSALVQDLAAQHSQVPYGRRLAYLARGLLDGYSRLQVSRRKDVLLSLPATSAGLEATRYLLSSSNRARINLTHVVSAAHAMLCVRAGATALSVSVGPIMKWHKVQARLYTGVRAQNAFARGIEAIHAILRYCHTAQPRVSVIGTEFDNHYQLAALWEFDAVALTSDQAQALPLLRQKLGPASDRSPYAVSKAAEAALASTAARERPLDTLPAADVAALASITQRAFASTTRSMRKIEMVLTAEIEKALKVESERETELGWWDIEGDCWAVIDAAGRAGAGATAGVIVIGNDDVEGWRQEHEELNEVSFAVSSERESSEAEVF